MTGALVYGPHNRYRPPKGPGLHNRYRPLKNLEPLLYKDFGEPNKS